MRFNHLAIMALMIMSTATIQAKTTTHEEEVVRTTYAKLSYADEIRMIMSTMNKFPDKWQADERAADKELSSRLEFQLSDFKSGPIKEVEGRIISEIAGMPPDGDTQGTLKVTPGTFNYTDKSGVASGDGHTTEWALYADIDWDTQPQRRFPGDGWPLAAVLDLKEMNGPYNSYATYSVTMTFQGKSRTYHTLALFGKNDNGTDKVHFLDQVSGGSAAMVLDLLAKTDMSTAPFSKTHLRNVPFVRKWLNDNRQSCSGKGHGDVCCDTETKRCGIGTAPVSANRSSNPYLVMAVFHPKISPVYATVQSSCSSFNFETFYNHGSGNSIDHVNGQHTFTSTVDGTCTYTAPAGVSGPGPCNVACNAGATGAPADFGTLAGVLPNHHVPGVASKTGQEGGNQTAQCQGTNAVSFTSCVSAGCVVNVTITGTSNGVGATIKFDNASLWNDSQATVHNCQARATQPTPTPTPPPPQPTPTPCDPDVPQDLRSGDPGSDPNPCSSPIIIDLAGNGFELTSATKGVLFDIANTGTPVQIAWTANTNNAFLVLDRDGSGAITSGAELFGNFTSQPSSPHPNGFLALAVYDDPMNGGNGDGIIDARDQIFSKLRLWVDANHDGISQPGELHTLPEMGIYSISLDYALSERKDQYGNLFRYRVRVNQGLHGPSDIGKTAYDVFLATQ